MRILIPSATRLEVLDKIHQGHQGITKCRERAKQAVWWPGLSRQIEDMVSSCRVCATHRINKPEPLCPTVFPERPWQVVGTDLFFSQSVDYLLVVDYFSRYVEVAALRENETALKIITALTAIFARNGIPEKVCSDNGPHMIVKNTAILQENGASKLHQVAPGMPSQIVRQRELYRQLRIF